MDHSDSQTGQMIAETSWKLMQSHCGAEQLRLAEGGWSAPLWAELQAAGLTGALEPPNRSQLDIPIGDALGILRIAGAVAAPVPLAEHMLANWLLLGADIDVPEGPLTIAPTHPRDRLRLDSAGAGWRLRGRASRVPWASQATHVAVVATHRDASFLALVPRAGYTVEPGENLAREARDTLVIDAQLDADAVRLFPAGFDYVYALGAGIRVVQMAGALDSVLGLSTRYVQERKQFGKPIGKFQAVQQNLAVMAGQVAAARSAANTVAHGFGADNPGHVMAGAKTRVGEAATIAAGLAHQVHGAMGFTQEYELHFFTKRLWSWRDEFGSEVYWSRHLGREVFQRGADATWDFITARMG